MINSGLAKKGEGFERLFKFCYEYRKMAVAGGEETPIMDLVVFRPLRMIFGGRLKFIATGKQGGWGVAKKRVVPGFREFPGSCLSNETCAFRT